MLEAVLGGVRWRVIEGVSSAGYRESMISKSSSVPDHENQHSPVSANQTDDPRYLREERDEGHGRLTILKRPPPTLKLVLQQPALSSLFNTLGSLLVQPGFPDYPVDEGAGGFILYYSDSTKRSQFRLSFEVGKNQSFDFGENGLARVNGRDVRAGWNSLLYGSA